MPVYFYCNGKVLLHFGAGGVPHLPQEGAFVRINERLYRVLHVIHDYDKRRTEVVIQLRM